jgi:hypothetical protein
MHLALYWSWPPMHYDDRLQRIAHLSQNHVAGNFDAKPLTGKFCDDGGACTEHDTCDSYGACKGTPTACVSKGNPQCSVAKCDECTGAPTCLCSTPWPDSALQHPAIADDCTHDH